MSKKKFDYRKLLKDRPVRNSDPLFVRIKTVFFGYYNKHSREDLNTILLMLKTLERQQLCLDKNQLRNMHAIVNNMYAKYEELWGPVKQKTL